MKTLNRPQGYLQLIPKMKSAKPIDYSRINKWDNLIFFKDRLMAVKHNNLYVIICSAVREGRLCRM